MIIESRTHYTALVTTVILNLLGAVSLLSRLLLLLVVVVLMLLLLVLAAVLRGPGPV